MKPVRPHPTTGEPIVDDEADRAQEPPSDPRQPQDAPETTGSSQQRRDDKPPPMQPGIMN